MFRSWSPLGVPRSPALLPFSAPRNGSSGPAAGSRVFPGSLSRGPGLGLTWVPGSALVLWPPNASLWPSSCDRLLARPVLSCAQESGAGPPHVNYLVQAWRRVVLGRTGGGLHGRHVLLTSPGEWWPLESALNPVPVFSAEAGLRSLRELVGRSHCPSASGT